MGTAQTADPPTRLDPGRGRRHTTTIRRSRNDMALDTGPSA
jgi:hypothetical protein